MIVKSGDVFSFERSFSVEDVRAFAALSLDRQASHTHVDAHGRLLVHGLMTASIATKLGGDMSYLAREMTFEFLRPVFTDEMIRCEVLITKAAPGDRRLDVELTCRCYNQAGKDVLVGSSKGVIFVDA